MKTFWRYHIRYRFARYLMLAGLWMWPPGTARDEVLTALYDWSDKMKQTLASVQRS